MESATHSLCAWPYFWNCWVNGWFEVYNYSSRCKQWTNIGEYIQEVGVHSSRFWWEQCKRQLNVITIFDAMHREKFGEELESRCKGSTNKQSFHTTQYLQTGFTWKNYDTIFAESVISRNGSPLQVLLIYIWAIIEWTSATFLGFLNGISFRWALLHILSYVCWIHR